MFLRRRPGLCSLFSPLSSLFCLSATRQGLGRGFVMPQRHWLPGRPRRGTTSCLPGGSVEMVCLTRKPLAENTRFRDADNTLLATMHSRRDALSELLATQATPCQQRRILDSTPSASRPRRKQNPASNDETKTRCLKRASHDASQTLPARTNPRRDALSELPATQAKHCQQRRIRDATPEACLPRRRRRR